MTAPIDIDALEQELTRCAADAVMYASLLGTTPAANAVRKFGAALTKAVPLIARLRAAEQARDEARRARVGDSEVVGRWQCETELLAAEVAGAAKDTRIAELETAAKWNSGNAGYALERLSLALTGGNASTWQQVLDAADDAKIAGVAKDAEIEHWVTRSKEIEAWRVSSAVLHMKELNALKLRAEQAEATLATLRRQEAVDE